MIESAEEFVRLRSSGDSADLLRTKREDAPLDVWLDLVNHHPDMRFWVTFNRHVPSDVLRLLVRDDDWRVRANIASRKGVPEDILETLSHDDHDAVVSSAAANPGTPTDALTRLSRHPWEEVRDHALAQLAERRER
ncbi:MULTISPECIES: hypothetical protein [unclassified Streptomyces]|uniref:hypothetical protein n=1 Tax=unclassified Streptomyces TaxID=2593676 RepID=UPI000361984C|nr:hypothetical protein [Streptomyces sp. 303MFCol5.2]